MKNVLRLNLFQTANLDTVGTLSQPIDLCIRATFLFQTLELLGTTTANVYLRVRTDVCFLFVQHPPTSPKLPRTSRGPMKVIF